MRASKPSAESAIIIAFVVAGLVYARPAGFISPNFADRLDPLVAIKCPDITRLAREKLSPARVRRNLSLSLSRGRTSRFDLVARD